MGKPSRDKGARGEREVVAILRAHGLDCDRTPNSGGLFIPGDVVGLDGFHLEVKRAERLKIGEWLRQAWEDSRPVIGERGSSNQTPIVIFRMNDAPENYPLGVWHACLPFEDLAALLTQAAILSKMEKVARVLGAES